MIKYIKSSTETHRRHSEYKGVKWDSQSQKWGSTLKHNGITYNCGYFVSDRAAARARDMKIISVGANKPLQILKSSK